MIRLEVILGETVPSFKNTKRAILDRNTGKMRTLTPGKIKKRMDRIEEGILSALYSLHQTGSDATDLACRNRVRTRLSGLCDDSLNQISEFSFGVKYVEKGQEGVVIEIEEMQ